MSDPYTQHVLRVAVAQICQTVGYTSATASAIDLLQDIAHKYLNEVARDLQQQMEQCHRTRPNLRDLELTMNRCSIDIPELLDYVTNVDAVPYVQDIPKYPVHKPENPLFYMPQAVDVQQQQRTNKLNDEQDNLMEQHAEKAIENMENALKTEPTVDNITASIEKVDKITPAFNGMSTTLVALDEQQTTANAEEFLPAQHKSGGVIPSAIIPDIILKYLNLDEPPPPTPPPAPRTPTPPPPPPPPPPPTVGIVEQIKEINSSENNNNEEGLLILTEQKQKTNKANITSNKLLKKQKKHKITPIENSLPTDKVQKKNAKKLLKLKENAVVTLEDINKLPAGAERAQMEKIYKKQTRIKQKCMKLEKQLPEDMKLKVETNNDSNQVVDGSNLNEININLPTGTTITPAPAVDLPMPTYAAPQQQETTLDMTCALNMSFKQAYNAPPLTTTSNNDILYNNNNPPMLPTMPITSGEIKPAKKRGRKPGSKNQPKLLSTTTSQMLPNMLIAEQQQFVKGSKKQKTAATSEFNQYSMPTYLMCTNKQTYDTSTYIAPHILPLPIPTKEKKRATKPNKVRNNAPAPMDLTTTTPQLQPSYLPMDMHKKMTTNATTAIETAPTPNNLVGNQLSSMFSPFNTSNTVAGHAMLPHILPLYPLRHHPGLIPSSQAFLPPFGNDPSNLLMSGVFPFTNINNNNKTINNINNTKNYQQYDSSPNLDSGRYCSNVAPLVPDSMNIPQTNEYFNQQAITTTTTINKIQQKQPQMPADNETIELSDDSNDAATEPPLSSISSPAAKFAMPREELLPPFGLMDSLAYKKRSNQEQKVKKSNKTRHKPQITPLTYGNATNLTAGVSKLAGGADLIPLTNTGLAYSSKSIPFTSLTTATPPATLPPTNALHNVPVQVEQQQHKPTQPQQHTLFNDITITTTTTTAASLVAATSTSFTPTIAKDNINNSENALNTDELFNNMMSNKNKKKKMKKTKEGKINKKKKEKKDKEKKHKEKLIITETQLLTDERELHKKLKREKKKEKQQVNKGKP